jgi:hypothetical protein
VLDEQTNTIQQGGYTMSKDTVMEARNPEKGTRDDLTDLLREGAKRLIAEAVDAELSATLAQFVDYKDGQVTGRWFARLLARTRRADRYRTGVGASVQDQRSQWQADQVHLGSSAAVS